LAKDAQHCSLGVCKFAPKKIAALAYLMGASSYFYALNFDLKV
jgi:hypothetical protein